MHISIQCGCVGWSAHVRVGVPVFGLVKECVFECGLLHGCARGSHIYLIYIDSHSLGVSLKDA